MSFFRGSKKKGSPKNSKQPTPEPAKEPEDRHAKLLASNKSTAQQAKPQKSATVGNTSRKGLLRLIVIEAKYLGDDDDIQSYFCVDYHGHEVRGMVMTGSEAKWNQEFSFDVTSEQKVVRLWFYNAKDDGLIGGGALIPDIADTEPKTQHVTLVGDARPDIPPQIKVKYWFDLATSGLKVSMDDFNIERVIGKGSFGKVMIVRKKDTGNIYALKKLSKQHLKERGEIEHTISERNILEKHNSPFLVSLKFSFQTPEKLYFVLDYVSGGELFVHLQRMGQFPEPQARFYTAMLVLALEHLHEKNIIYRDLKPENILIDMNGYIKLTDFGLCKEGVDRFGRTATFCGTPEYMAPEILQQKGYGMEVDWWTVGTLLYEMLTGLPPFYDEDTQEMYRKILFQPLTFPEDVSLMAQDIIAKLLQRTPAQRLGKFSAEEIKEHLFFKGLEWDALAEKRLPAPWKPEVKEELDTSNFDEEFTSLRPIDTPMQGTQLTDEEQSKFQGFTYADAGELG
eukprot:TRINITY_DN11866_c3_g3_i7.p1 TRINITY_DN11866_c3_g3~~TRINITY_DN11866_c3_g3_i7.p1  ORF type:complete len:509 (+),score=148.32 TRINITY_DN11866_c3_g3_i7:149-1675(+)